MDNRVSSATVFQGEAFVKGTASGKLIASDLELSFWGGVNPDTGEIIDRHHKLSGQRLQNTIFAIPSGRGSCSGSGVMLELLLNEKGPKAILFERREEILTLGVMIAEEIFGKSIPVVVLQKEDFRKILRLDGQCVYIVDERVSNSELIGQPDTKPPYLSVGGLTSSANGVQLSQSDRAFLDGVCGEAARVSMRIILRMAELLGAQELMDISQVHVDGCVYTGPGSLLFAERLRDWGGKVHVPTSLNSISVDQKRWRAQGIDPALGEAAAKLADAYIDMGAQPTFTCAPYQLANAPKFGQQIAWAESNAVVYANSVLGARTMKYPDFLDISIALTGRAPKAGPHLDVNRQASLVINVCAIREIKDIDDVFYPLLGYHVGTLASSEIPVIVGIEPLRPSRDDLKAFGAAFATTSSAPMFHITGVTPEAPVLDAVIGSGPHIRSVDIDPQALNWCWDKLNSASKHHPVDLVSLGNPHFSFAEIRKLAEFCRGRCKKDNVSVVVTCGRTSYGLACQAGLVKELERFGVDFITDTCWCMITKPTIPLSQSAIMTNSGKYAYYGPGLTGKSFHFGSLASCVEVACQGGLLGSRPVWLLDEFV